MFIVADLVSLKSKLNWSSITKIAYKYINTMNTYIL